MPYVSDMTKQQLNAGREPVTVGELTYLLQQQLNLYLLAKPRMSFAHLAECLGALEAAKVDLTERLLHHYEAGKAAQNGDVWAPELIAQAMGL